MTLETMFMSKRAYDVVLNVSADICEELNRLIQFFYLILKCQQLLTFISTINYNILRT